jgi:hypothetical protein
MPQLIAFALLGAGVIAGARVVRYAVERIREEMTATSAEQFGSRSHENHESIKDLGPLEFDPRAGVYRPKQP